MVNLRLQEPESALAPLRKLHTLLPDQPEVVHCIALAHDMMGDAQVRPLEGSWRNRLATACVSCVVSGCSSA